jgi:hypothetical protein
MLANDGKHERIEAASLNILDCLDINVNEESAYRGSWPAVLHKDFRKHRSGI